MNVSNAKPSSREKRIQFINGFGFDAMKDGIVALYRRDGVDVFTDEQIEQIAEHLASRARISRHLNIKNRRLAARA